MDFNAFPKIARLNREMVITEKIDGTNASIEIRQRLDSLSDKMAVGDAPLVAAIGEFDIYAGSRTRYITPESDNQGFAKWVKAHAEELIQLGPGQHFGEWWGQGIQRTYGLTEKRFSLFNVSRWTEKRPACCGVVPMLYQGAFDSAVVNATLTLLGAQGSIVAPGFMKPEGIVVYHTAANQMFKVTLEKDSEWKGKRNG